MTNVDVRFVEELASAAPTPGGGGASAYAGALASALASMVGNLTVGKKRYADVEESVQDALGRLEQERACLIGLIDRDAEAFGPLAQAYRMPKETPEQQEEKHAAMQAALVDACEVPLEIMRHVAKVTELTEYLSLYGSKMARSDAGVAAAFARAASDGASLNIYINISSMDDEMRASAYRIETEQLAESTGELCDAIFKRVRDELR